MGEYRYKVFLVDDEPASLQLISNIIKLRCPEVEIAGTADSVAGCLKQLEHAVPDILISDIRMPGTTGIDLIAEVRRRYPDIVNVLVSGYQEFEYAKAAMKLDVEEYLLKPVVPDEFCEIMGQLERKVDLIFSKRRSAILTGREGGGEIFSSRYFPYESYYAALIRKNGLPKRFISAGNEEEQMQQALTKGPNLILGGRDPMETLYLVPAKLVEDQDLPRLLRHAYDRERQNASYVTMVTTRRGFGASEIPGKIKALQECLDHRLVIGVSQIFCVEDGNQGKTAGRYDYRGVIRRFEQYLEENRIDEAEKELRMAGEYFSDCQVTQRELEGILNMILLVLEAYLGKPDGDRPFEHGFEEILANAGDMREIFAELAGLPGQAADRKGAGKLDSPEYIDQMICYLESHLTEDITMKTIARRFGISQTYLGQLFHKYQKTSFSNFVIDLRITRAKQLLARDQKILIRDVARQVGYDDQFYFSRIFRNTTGMTPSEYTAQIADAGRDGKSGGA